MHTTKKYLGRRARASAWASPAGGAGGAGGAGVGPVDGAEEGDALILFAVALQRQNLPEHPHLPRARAPAHASAPGRRGAPVAAAWPVARLGSPDAVPRRAYASHLDGDYKCHHVELACGNEEQKGQEHGEGETRAHLRARPTARQRASCGGGRGRASWLARDPPRTRVASETPAPPCSADPRARGLSAPRTPAHASVAGAADSLPQSQPPAAC